MTLNQRVGSSKLSRRTRSKLYRHISYTPTYTLTAIAAVMSIVGLT